MNYILKFEKFLSKNKLSIEDHIYYAHIPKEYKEIALNHLKNYTYVSKSRIFGLKLHTDLISKIKEKNLPDGFDMGVDKKGWFIHTHRARSKSHPSPDKITIKEIKFIDSTG